ncbi:MAG: hypothetical protein P8Y43_09175 [Sulfurovaceae bacterium]
MKMLMRLLSIGLLLSVFAFAQQQTQKVVVDLTTGDAKTITSHFIKGFANTLEYLQKNGSDVDAVVIIHGDAYRFFVQKLEQSPYSNDQDLRNLTKDIFYPFVHPVPSAQISLIEWQNRGYAYLPFR